jgi:hypothetical protein
MSPAMGFLKRTTHRINTLGQARDDITFAINDKISIIRYFLATQRCGSLGAGASSKLLKNL